MAKRYGASEIAIGCYEEAQQHKEMAQIHLKEAQGYIDVAESERKKDIMGLA